jgi:hypothetical protein
MEWSRNEKCNTLRLLIPSLPSNRCSSVDVFTLEIKIFENYKNFDKSTHSTNHYGTHNVFAICYVVTSRCMLVNYNDKVKVMLRPTVSRPVCLGISTHLGLTTRILLLSDSCWVVDVGRCLWREDGSVVYNCSWPSLAPTFSGPTPVGLGDHNLLSQILDFPIRRLLRLSGLRWRYSTPPPHGIPHGTRQSQSQSHIPTDSQSVGLSWCRAPSGAYDQKLVYLF